MTKELKGLSATALIETLLQSGVEDYKEEKSRAGELVKLKVTKELVKNGQIKIKLKVKGSVSKEVYETYDLEFEKILYPYYYMELVKLAIKVYWSGKKMNKKTSKRIVYMNRYGERNKEYFNRSFRYIYWLKKPVTLFKK